MKKYFLITAIILVLVLIFGSVFYLLFYFGIVSKFFPSLGAYTLKIGLKQRCGGVMGAPCPNGYTCEYDNENIVDDVGTCTSENKTTENINENGTVEYNETKHGKICPLKIKFLGKKSTNLVGCKCPEGWEMQSDIIGYEQCYGPGTECPILVSECKKSKD